MTKDYIQIIEGLYNSDPQRLGRASITMNHCDAPTLNRLIREYHGE